jgi:hypothetical protein
MHAIKGHAYSSPSAHLLERSVEVNLAMIKFGGTVANCQIKFSKV